MDAEKDTGDPLGLSQEDLESLFEGTLKQNFTEPADLHQKQHLKRGSFGGSSEGSLETSQSERADRRKNAASARPRKDQSVDKETGGAKSSLRMKYEAEKESLKKTHGDLEAIRRKLGLSKRKMAQLLLVDPSAWTRWTRNGGEAPPHIYRSLQWYLLLQEKHPEYKSSLWLNAVSTPSLSDHEIQNIQSQVIATARETLERERPSFSDFSESVDLSPLQGQLMKARQEVGELQQKLKMLWVVQAAVVAAVFFALLFFFIVSS